MGKDMQSSAILVGKALNDPIKGMSALSKAGIQFTAEQKETIKTMVASGKTMDAQKMILKELETQFGGSAEAAGKTFSGQMNIAKQTALNFAGDIIARVIPVLQNLVAYIQENWPKIRATFESVVNDIRAIWKQWGDEIMAVVRFVFPIVQQMIQNTLRIIGGIIDVFVGLLTGDWSRAWNGLKNIVGGALDAIELMLRTAVTVLLKVATLIGEAIKDGVVAGLKGIGTAAWEVINKIGSVLQDVRNQIVGWGRSIANAIKEGIIDALSGLGNLIWDKVKDAWNFAKDKLKSLGGLIPGSGDASDPNFNPFIVPPTAAMPPGTASDLMGAQEVMRPFANAAAGYGLSISSGLRGPRFPGDQSDHMKGKALDVVGSASGMAGFFRSLIGNPSVRQAFYDPLGSIFGGRQSPYIEGGHNDHVHVATYDKGGILRPGWTMAYNGTGRNEFVGKGGGNVYLTVNMPNYLGDKREAARAIRDELRNLDRVETGGRTLNSRVSLA
jgi:hypothetical protein